MLEPFFGGLSSVSKMMPHFCPTSRDSINRERQLDETVLGPHVQTPLRERLKRTVVCYYWLKWLHHRFSSFYKSVDGRLLLMYFGIQ